MVIRPTNQLVAANDSSVAELGKALHDILLGVPPETALARLPTDLRDAIASAL
ncbi:MAG: hypothetical protein M9928_02745 [Anaerolineae bacterium]|nr:hypothetical protein [Anaerolineae bacterium]MCO5193364.1 hypothetical protein [Anaerolineae bacterium]MCO5203923.1 hypothetical protein [Anaerolineae bacterium]